MRKYLLVTILLTMALCSNAQDDLLKELEANEPQGTDYAFQTFKGTRLVNGHTVETKGAGNLEFIFAHRFGSINGGSYELFGLDEAYVRLGLDYGITDNLSVSIGRNSADKIMDGYLKYKIVRQSKGGKNFPVTITALAGTAYSLDPKKDDEPDGFKSVDRLAYTAQLLIARKFTTNLSLQLMPTLIHKNAVSKMYEDNDHIAIGLGGRLKVTKSVALTCEYYHRLNPTDNDLFPELKRFNPIGFGVDIETGGHVFQLIITNTSSLTERTFITETDGEVGEGDIHLGFNVTRTFQLKKKK
jgi:hypothetical protein